MGEDFDNHRRIFDGGDALQAAGVISSSRSFELLPGEKSGVRTHHECYVTVCSIPDVTIRSAP
jgi:hypothetical protein